MTRNNRALVICEHCFWWERAREKRYGVDRGFCHRYPPGVGQHFPITFNTCWCGEFQRTCQRLTTTNPEEDADEAIHALMAAGELILAETTPTSAHKSLWNSAWEMGQALVKRREIVRKGKADETDAPL
jgi:hypothetical protein